jgi:deoxyribose-phosphate aldolase
MNEKVRLIRTKEEVMKKEEILKYVDHTLLLQTATWGEIKEICDDAVKYGVASIMIPPCYVRQAVDYVGGKCPVATVIGFPNGNTTTATKLFEAKEALENGAREIDMVINIGWLKDGKYDQVEEEIRALKEAAGEKVLKVIIETCLLTDEEKIKMCELCAKAGADFIKTSTGFSKSGATFEDVKLMKEHASGGLKVKAAGGIKSLDDAEKFIELGAERLGTSRIVKIIKEQENA